VWKWELGISILCDRITQFLFKGLPKLEPIISFPEYKLQNTFLANLFYQYQIPFTAAGYAYCIGFSEKIPAVYCQLSRMLE